MNHAPDRERKLLLHKREILKLGGKVTGKGLTLVPLRAYLRRGRVKLEIGLGRGKQAHDKRESHQAARHRARRPARRLPATAARPEQPGPPSTPTDRPLMNDGEVGGEEDVHRRDLVGLPRRRAGRRASVASSSPAGTVRVVSESIRPGATALAVIPRGPSSRAQVRVMPTTAAFDAA